MYFVTLSIKGESEEHRFESFQSAHAFYSDVLKVCNLSAQGMRAFYPVFRKVA